VSIKAKNVPFDGAQDMLREPHPSTSSGERLLIHFKRTFPLTLRPLTSATLVCWANELAANKLIPRPLLLEREGEIFLVPPLFAREGARGEFGGNNRTVHW
jgi:hypothetical protein